MAPSAINLQRCQTRYFGSVEFDKSSLLEFPEGLPGFEQERRFLMLRQPQNQPLAFLQSVDNPGLCFVTLPAHAACPGFRLSLNPEDLEALDLETGRQPAPGRDVLCLAILSFAENAPPTANLLAPIVVNLRTLRARQTLQAGSRYSLREPLPLREAACS
jgi:flagellar assembly factor FliW